MSDSSQEHTFNIAEAIDAAFPRKPTWKGYKTSRSGLPVTIQPGLVGRADKSKGVKIYIDGVVDRADAEQLAQFFTALAIRLKEYW